MVIEDFAKGVAESSGWITCHQYGADLGNFARIGISLAEIAELVRNWTDSPEAETRNGDDPGPGHRPQKELIEKAYIRGEKMGLEVWVEDEAGPYQTVPYAGQSWQPEGHPAQQPHEYVRNGTAKMLTFFHPASGEVRVKGVTTATNAILHPWFKEQLSEILNGIPEKPILDSETNRQLWTCWQEGLSRRITLSEQLPPLRMLLIWDNLRGHHTPEMVLWLFEHGVMPLYTPVAGSWLNMAESIQRILVRRALEGQNPQSPAQIVAWLEAIARGWNEDPTPFEWGGKRAARRERSHNRRHALGGSGACSRRPLRAKSDLVRKWQSSCQLTH